MTIISAENICYEIGNISILNNICFSINEGDKLGIVGVNGSGKSTLLNIITNNITNYSGNVYVSKNKNIGYLKQNDFLNSERTLFDEMLTIYSNLIELEKKIDLCQKTNDFTSMSKYTELNEIYIKNGGLEYKNRISSMLEKFGYSKSSFDKKISSLSGGEKTRLALIKLLLLSPDILVLDEPTNSLDIDTLTWLETFLTTYKKTIIIVSHDRFLLDSVTNKILEIENHKGTIYNGNFSKFLQQKEERKKRLEKEFNIQEKEISRIESIIEQQRSFGQERNFKTIKSKEKQIDRLKKINGIEKSPREISFHFSKSNSSGNDVLIVEDLKKSYNSKILFDNLSFTVKRNDKFLILGKNGTGKTTLLKILCDNLEYDSGNFTWGYNVNVGYYSQAIDDLNEDNTIFDEISDCYPNLNNTEIRNNLARFQFKSDDILKKCSVLSGGERARLTLCKMILSKYNVLVLDEPTNHLDIASCKILENALLEYDGTIIAVSHDRYFINVLATRILYFDNNCYQLFYGTYDEFKSKLIANKTDEIILNVQSTKKQPSINKQKYETNKLKISNLKKHQTKQKNLEKKIEENEQLIVKLYKDIESNSNDYKKVSELSNFIHNLEEENENLFEEIIENENLIRELEKDLDNE